MEAALARLLAQVLNQASAGMVVKVEQQHVSHKTNHEPGSRFQHAFKTWSHEERIPHQYPSPADLQRQR
jgi:hypothetical protein